MDTLLMKEERANELYLSYDRFGKDVHILSKQ